jgi:hypothetical protein
MEDTSMATITQETRFELARRELVTLADARDQVLTCDSGELWITVDGDRRDIILGPGESYRIERAAPVVVSATRAATLTVAHTQAFAPRGSMLASLLNWRFPPLAAFASALIR